MDDISLMRQATRRLPALFAFCVCFALGSAFAAPKAGDKAPDFLGRDREGQAVSVSTYAGRIVVLSFWASWCGPCQRELPMLEGIQQTAGKERIQVIAVNIESSEMFRKIARRTGSLQMLVASDAAKDAQQAYGVSGIPHMVIVGKDGQIMRVHRGYSDAGVDDVIEDLNQALAR